MSWGRLFKTQFQAMFHVSTLHVCAFISQFMKLFLFFFLKAPKRLSTQMWSTPGPPTLNFFPINRLVSLGEMKGSLVLAATLFTQSIPDVFRDFFSITCPIWLKPALFFWNHAKGCQTKSRQSEVDKWGEGDPLEVLLDQAKTKNFNGDKSKRTQVATKLGINPKRYDDIESQCARCVCRKWFTFWWPRDFEWVILHLTVSWFRNYEKLLDLR